MATREQIKAARRSKNAKSEETQQFVCVLNSNKTRLIRKLKEAGLVRETNNELHWNIPTE